MIVEEEKIEIVEDEERIKKSNQPKETQKNKEKKSQKNNNKNVKNSESNKNNFKSTELEKKQTKNKPKSSESEKINNSSVEIEKNKDNFKPSKENKLDTETSNKNNSENTEHKEDSKILKTENTKKIELNSTTDSEKENINLKNDKTIVQKEQIKTNTFSENKKSQIYENFSNNYTDSNSKSTLKIFSIICAVMFLILLIIFTIFSVYNYTNEKIINGIYISNIDVSKLTKAQAIEKLNQYYSENLNGNIILQHNDFETEISLNELEVNFDTDSAVNYAYKLGKSGNIFIDDFNTFTHLFNTTNITPNININNEYLSEILNEISTQLPGTVIDSSYYIEGTELILTKGTEGIKVNINKMTEEIINKLTTLTYKNEPIKIITVEATPSKIDLQTIYNEIYKEPKDAYYTTDPYVVYPSENGLDFKISLEEAQKLLDENENSCTIPLKLTPPNITTNMIGTEAFPDLLSTFSTKYVASNVDRTTNLRLAASKINGYVLLPGETFSYNTVVGERTISAGYKEAPIYLNGQVVPGLGGGICQISTTLYNAVVFSNLEIIERHNHQFIPSYAGAGRDATVVYGTKDFQFKNNRNYAIKITCSVSGGIAKFELWGLKQDPEYDINISTTITSQTSSYIKSTTYKTTKLNGTTISKEILSKDTYKVH